MKEDMKMSTDEHILDLFKVVVVDFDTKLSVNLDYVKYGVVLDFNPTSEQKYLIETYLKDSQAKTLFSVQEIEELTSDALIMKQLSHYALSYTSGYTFDLKREEDGSNVVPMVIFHAVVREQLQNMVDEILYANRPVKDANAIRDIVREYGLSYNVNDIKNNEIKVTLFDESKDVFVNGDDAVRYLVYRYTGNALLIKSKEVISAIQQFPSKMQRIDLADFLFIHFDVLAEVFNRHKRILMAIKIGNTSKGIKRAINQISRASKKLHVPIAPNPVKTFLIDFVRDENYSFRDMKNFTLRDKLKLLNHLEFKKQGLTTDVFMIRNGKTHVEPNRKVYDKHELNEAINEMLTSISYDLDHLEYANIILPKDIDYGLPVSRKQTLGGLPFGTKIKVDAGAISSGIYWKNDWGAYDLDLSTINVSGDRTGWGCSRGYNGADGISFSGDVVSAQNGALEFMTSNSKTPKYALFVNIYTGNVPSKAELVVGAAGDKKWMDGALIRESFTMESKGNVIGFVDGDTFTVFQGRINGSAISTPANASIIQKGQTFVWTVKKLFNELGIVYHEQGVDGAEHDLSYANFTYDKLEKLFNI